RHTPLPRGQRRIPIHLPKSNKNGPRVIRVLAPAVTPAAAPPKHPVSFVGRHTIMQPVMESSTAPRPSRLPFAVVAAPIAALLGAAYAPTLGWLAGRWQTDP